MPDNISGGNLYASDTISGAHVMITARANYGTVSAAAGTLVIDNGTVNPGDALVIQTSHASPTSDSNLVRIESENASYDRPLLRIIDQSTAGGAASIRIDSPNPDIEFVESDQTAPNGKFELAVQSDAFQFSGRNEADNSFRTVGLFSRPGVVNHGRFGIGFNNLTNPVVLSAHLHVINDINPSYDASAATIVVSRFDGAAAQTADLTQWGTVSGAILANVTPSGTISGAQLFSVGGFTGTGVFTTLKISGGIILSAT